MVMMYECYQSVRRFRTAPRHLEIASFISFGSWGPLLSLSPPKTFPIICRRVVDGREVEVGIKNAFADGIVTVAAAARRSVTLHSHLSLLGDGAGLGRLLCSATTRLLSISTALNSGAGSIHHPHWCARYVGGRRRRRAGRGAARGEPQKKARETPHDLAGRKLANKRSKIPTAHSSRRQLSL